MVTREASRPPQLQLCLPDGGSDVIVHPGTLSGPRVAGVEASPCLAARPAGERVTAWTLLLSTEDGRPVLLCDSARLTGERTAGTTAVAVDALVPAGAGTLAGSVTHWTRPDGAGARPDRRGAERPLTAGSHVG